jgi:hypothetical protein
MIEFTSDNRPICEPTTQAECTLNWAALQDVYDALDCLETVLHYDTCYNLEDYIEKDTDTEISFDVEIDKDDVAEVPEMCDIDVYVNGRRAMEAYSTDPGFGNVPYFTLSDTSDLVFTVSIFPGQFAVDETTTAFVYKIVIRKYKTFSELFNACEATINCRD